MKFLPSLCQKMQQKEEARIPKTRDPRNSCRGGTIFSNIDRLFRRETQLGIFLHLSIFSMLADLKPKRFSQITL
jgi:hypothetical protein